MRTRIRQGNARLFQSTVLALVSELAMTVPFAHAQGMVRFDFPNGYPVLDTGSQGQNAPVSVEVFRLVQDKVVQKELELVDKQATDLARAVKTCREATSTWYRTRVQPSTNVWSSPTELDPAILKINQQFLDQLSEILVPHQAEKLDSIYYRILLNQRGLFELAKQVAAQYEIAMTPDQNDAIRELENEFDRKLFEECLDKYRDFLERVGNKLPANKELLAPFAQDELLVSLDILFVNFENIDDLTPKTVGHSVHDLMEKTRWATCSFNGNWQFDGEHEPALFGLINALMYKSGDAGGLITADQKSAIAEISGSWYSQQRKEVHDEYEALLARGNDPREALEYRRNAEARIEKQAFTEIEEEILLPAQREWIVQSLRQREINSYGVLGILVMESSPEGNGIADNERDEIREFLRAEVLKLRDDITSEFHSTFDKQVARLPDEIKTKARRLIGEPPEYLRPNLCVLASRVLQ